MISKCAICGIVVKNKNIKLFKPPSSELKRQRWNESCGIIFKDSSRVCESHFLRTDFICAPRDPSAARPRLMPGAVPSLLCGNALREEEIVCRMETTKKEEVPVTLNEVKEQATCEPLIKESQCIPIAKVNLFCRTCLTTIGQHTNGDGQKYNVHKTQDLAKWIYECTQLEVNTNDGYPKYLCQECYHKLQSFNEFRATCKQSMVFLSSVLNSNKSGEKDPIELEMASTKMQVCEDKGLTAVEEISDQADCWKLEAINDISIELENIKDTSEDEKLVEIKLENNVILEKKLQQHTGSYNPKLESTDTLKEGNCNEEFLVDATEFLETGNFCSNDIIEYCPDGDFSVDILLKSMLPIQQQQMIDATQSTSRALKFKCDICQRHCKNEIYLAAHLRAHQGFKKPFQCRHCDQTYSQMNHLRRHIFLMHKGVKDNDDLLTCPFMGCDKQFQLFQNLRSHYRAKHIVGQTTKAEPVASLFMCEVCGLNFKTAKALDVHSYKHRPKEEYPYKCDKCDKCYVIKQYFRDHQLRHAGIKNYVCPYCGLRKTTRNELKTHVNYHTKQKQWYCPLCPRVFNNSSNLTLHDRIVHKQIRKYKCSYCGQGFGRLEHLRNHEMRHTGEKPHACQICGRRYISGTTLKTHMKTHHGEKIYRKVETIRKFKCSHCELRFRSLKGVQNHEVKHTGEKPHMCQTCGKSFGEIRYLRCHLRYHEPEDTRPKRGCRIALREKLKQQQSEVKEDQLDTKFLNLDSNDDVE